MIIAKLINLRSKYPQSLNEHIKLQYSLTGKKLKIVMIGDSRVGKTSLRKQYMGEGFRGTYTATLGAEFSVKKIRDDTISIFDLGGDPQTKMLRKQYYFGTDGILMVFDITNRISFENLEGWFDEVSSNVVNKFPVFILGNKEDLRDENENPVSEEEAYNFTKSKADLWNASVSYLSTSALTGYNVEVAFNKLVTEISFREEANQA